MDLFGERVINEKLAGGGWTRRHNSIIWKLNALACYAGLPVEYEVYGIFAHLLPQQALSRLEKNRTRQVLRPDFRLDYPSETGVVVTRLADIETIGLGGKTYYKPGFKGRQNKTRAVDRRTAWIQVEYRDKAARMDEAMGKERGRGPVSRRLEEFKQVIDLCFGGYGEASDSVHKLVEVLAKFRVKSLSLATGWALDTKQLGLEMSLIRRRLSTAVIRTNQTLLLSCLGQVGDGRA